MSKISSQIRGFSQTFKYLILNFKLKEELYYKQLEILFQLQNFQKNNLTEILQQLFVLQTKLRALHQSINAQEAIILQDDFQVCGKSAVQKFFSELLRIQMIYESKNQRFQFGDQNNNGLLNNSNNQVFIKKKLTEGITVQTFPQVWKLVQIYFFKQLQSIEEFLKSIHVNYNSYSMAFQNNDEKITTCIPQLIKLQTMLISAFAKYRFNSQSPQALHEKILERQSQMENPYEDLELEYDMTHYFDNRNGINDQFSELFSKQYEELVKQNKKKIIKQIKQYNQEYYQKFPIVCKQKLQNQKQLYQKQHSAQEIKQQQSSQFKSVHRLQNNDKQSRIFKPNMNLQQQNRKQLAPLNKTQYVQSPQYDNNSQNLKPKLFSVQTTDSNSGNNLIKFYKFPTRKLNLDTSVDIFKENKSLLSNIQPLTQNNSNCFDLAKSQRQLFNQYFKSREEQSEQPKDQYFTDIKLFAHKSNLTASKIAVNFKVQANNHYLQIVQQIKNNNCQQQEQIKSQKDDFLFYINGQQQNSLSSRYQQNEILINFKDKKNVNLLRLGKIIIK